MGSKFTTTVLPDHVMITETPGGGGWGNPRLRDPEAVRRDVSEGLVSAERARTVYRVALDSNLNVDQAETIKLREA